MDLLSTSEAARVIGAGTTSVKRWADTGQLECVRTAGGHRRFTRSALDRFMRFQMDQEVTDYESDRWVDVFLSASNYEPALIQARGRLGSWCQVAAELHPALAALGARCEASTSALLVVSERLARALARISESLLLPAGASRCVLACVEGERHTLGLSFAEVCVRELGWGPLWLGAMTPTAAIIERVQLDDRVRLVGLSASSSADPSALDRIQLRVASACRDRGVELLLGGSGPWPEDLRYGIRISSFQELEGLHSQLRQRAHRVQLMAG